MTGLGLFVLFVIVERSAKDPLMPFSIWKNPVILYANLVSFTTGAIYDWGFRIFTDICHWGYGATCDYCRVYTYCNVNRLATCLVSRWSFVNQIWYVFRIIRRWNLAHFGDDVICLHACGIRPMVGGDCELFRRCRYGVNKYVLYRHDSGSCPKGKTWDSNCCKYVHEKLWEYSWCGIVWSNFKRLANDGFQ